MIRVPQRLDYALRVLVALAERPEGTRVAAGDLADMLGLPRRFVEQQITELARARVVDCVRGAGGGCALAKPADTVTVLDVVRVLEGVSIDVPRTTGSAVAEMWADVEVVLDEALGAVTLGELAERQRRIEAEAAALYMI